MQNTKITTSFQKKTKNLSKKQSRQGSRSDTRLIKTVTPFFRGATSNKISSISKTDQNTNMPLKYFYVFLQHPYHKKGDSPQKYILM